jgi:putative acetyltransferase
MKFDIRNEEENDFDPIRAILQATFPSEAESKLVDALHANGKAVISLVAVNNEVVLGHILFSPVTTFPPSELIREGLRLCKNLKYDYCVVLGSPKYYQLLRLRCGGFGRICARVFYVFSVIVL